jgi:hypothetical protein
MNLMKFLCRHPFFSPSPSFSIKSHVLLYSPQIPPEWHRLNAVSFCTLLISFLPTANCLSASGSSIMGGDVSSSTICTSAFSPASLASAAERDVCFTLVEVGSGRAKYRIVTAWSRVRCTTSIGRSVCLAICSCVAVPSTGTALQKSNWLSTLRVAMSGTAFHHIST